MKKIKIEKLIQDFTLYPRVRVDDQHVAYMVDSLKSGKDLPPIIADSKSLRIIDGFHRVEAFKRIKSEDILVELREYKDEREMFVAAMQLNANHGRTLTRYDRTHCILRAEELGVSIDAMSEALSLTIDKIDELRTDRIGELKFRGGLRHIPLKRTINHMKGNVLTERQVEANEKLSGMNQAFYVNQLIELIESDLLDISDERLMSRLDYLDKLLTEKILVKIN